MIEIRKAYPNELCHYGIKGQHWGERRFQYENGALTPAGRQRYLTEGSGTVKRRGEGLGTGKVGNTGGRPASSPSKVTTGKHGAGLGTGPVGNGQRPTSGGGGDSSPALPVEIDGKEVDEEYREALEQISSSGEFWKEPNGDFTTVSKDGSFYIKAHKNKDGTMEFHVYDDGDEEFKYNGKLTSPAQVKALMNKQQKRWDSRRKDREITDKDDVSWNRRAKANKTM